MKIEDLDVPDSVKEILTKAGTVELYPPQKEAVDAGALKGSNLVLASPTASGKTLVAELCALRHVMKTNGKTIYLTPLRALASEKYQEFKKYSSLRKANKERIRIGISTGDYDSTDSWLGRYDIIVTTNEKADSLLRHRAKWMDEVSLLVADEVHLLNDGDRGPTLEVVLARLLQINPDVQILALSATIQNVKEIAEWLDARYITTDWRPIRLREGVVLHEEVVYKDGGARRVKKRSGHPTVNLALNAIRSGGQALIFASTRRRAVALAKKAANDVQEFLTKPTRRVLQQDAQKILSAGERTRISEQLHNLIKGGAAFHHAGLSSSQRKVIEDSFRMRRIKVLTATPTLAFGVNLPARVVVIQDYKRYESGYGYYPISVLEYKQMAGRAGRPKYDNVGEAILAAKTSDEADYLMESYVLAKPERIWSRLGVEKVLRSHVLATIAADFAKTERGVYDFFAKTFYAHQYDVEAIKSMISKILGYLHDEEMIEVAPKQVCATKFGRRASELYIDPASAVIFRDSLRCEPTRLSDLSLLHMISHTPDMTPKLRPYTRELEKIALFMEEHRGEFLMEVPSEWEDGVAYEEFLGEVKTAVVLKRWIEEASEDEMIERFQVQPGDLYRTIQNARWLLHAAHELALLFGRKQLLQHTLRLSRRIEGGVKAELLPIVKLDGVGRVRGRILFDAGYRTLEDMKHVAIDDLTRLPLIGTRLAKRIKEQVGGFFRKKEWSKLDEGWEQRALTEY